MFSKAIQLRWDRVTSSNKNNSQIPNVWRYYKALPKNSRFPKMLTYIMLSASTPKKKKMSQRQAENTLFADF